MSYIKLTDLVRKIYKEKSYELISAPKVKPPDIDKIFKKIDKEVEDENKVVYLYEVKAKQQPPRAKFLKKAIILAASIMVLSIMFSIFMDTPQAKAVKLNIMNTMIRFKEQIIEITNSNNSVENKDSNITDSSTE